MEPRAKQTKIIVSSNFHRKPMHLVEKHAYLVKDKAINMVIYYDVLIFTDSQLQLFKLRTWTQRKLSPSVVFGRFIQSEPRDSAQPFFSSDVSIDWWMYFSSVAWKVKQNSFHHPISVTMASILKLFFVLLVKTQGDDGVGKSIGILEDLIKRTIKTVIVVCNKDW